MVDTTRHDALGDDAPGTEPTGLDTTGSAAEVDQRSPLVVLSQGVTVLSAVSFDALLPNEVAAVTAMVARLKGRVAVLEAALTTRIQSMSVEGDAPAVERVLTRSGRLSGRDADRTVRTAETLEAFPAVGDGLGDGTISTGHVDALTSLWGRLDDSDRALWQNDAAELAERAGELTPEEFGRELKRRHRRQQQAAGLSPDEQARKANSGWVDTNVVTGRTRITADVDPLTAQRMTTAINAEMAAMRARDDLGDLHPDRAGDPAHLRAHAIARLITRGHHARTTPGRATVDRTDAQVTQILVIVDLDTLTNGLHDHSICELGSGHPIDIATVRRLACEAGIIPVVLSGDGVVLDQGRSKRLATPEQRQALRTMYRTCAGPGCQVPFDDCEVHHVNPWGNLGDTDLDQLVPLCTRRGGHHQQAHDPHYRYSLDADRTLHIHNPDDTWDHQPLRPLHHVGTEGDVADRRDRDGDQAGEAREVGEAAA